MQYILDNSDLPSNNKYDCIVIPIFSGKSKNIELSDAAKQIDKASKGSISSYVDTGDFKATLEQTHLLYNLNNISASRVLLVGCGDKGKFDISSINKATKAASKVLKSSSVKSVSFYRRCSATATRTSSDPTAASNSRTATTATAS